MELMFSSHAREQMIARGISVEDIKTAIKRGSKSLQNPDKLLFSYQYFCVITKKINEKYFIITVMLR